MSHPMPSPFFIITARGPIRCRNAFPLPRTRVSHFTLSFDLNCPARTRRLDVLRQLNNDSRQKSVRPYVALTRIMSLQRRYTRITLRTSLRRCVLSLIHTAQSRPRVALNIDPHKSITYCQTIRTLTFLRKHSCTVPSSIGGLTPRILTRHLVPINGTHPRSLVSRLLTTAPVP